MTEKTFVYIAGPYMDSNKTHDHTGYHEIEQNISRAREAAAFLATNGVPYFCPHLNACHFEVIAPAVKPEFWYDMDLRILKGASAILLLEGYQNSHGTKMEIEAAIEMDIPYFLPPERRQLLKWWKK